MAERILVTGATGKLGREVVRLLREQGEVVRLATRFPTAARELFGPEQDVIELDYDATETYDAAVQWVDRIFLMPPPFDTHAYQTLVPFLDWAVGSGVSKVVLVSAMGAESRPDLALRLIELHLETLGIAAVVLRPNLYHQNFASGFLRDSIRTRGEIELSAGDARVSFVDVRDVARVAAVALTSPALDGQACTLTGPAALSLHEIATILTEASGRPVRYRPVEDGRMRELLQGSRWPDGQVEVVTAMLRSVREGARESVVPPPAALGRAPIPFDQFARENAQLWR